MKITKPDDFEREPSDTATEPMIEVDYRDDPIPITEFAKNTNELIGEVLANPHDFGLVPEDHVSKIENHLEQLQKKVETLEYHIDLLAATSKSPIYGQCPECGGRLEEKSPLLQEDHIACTVCDFKSALLE